MTTPFNSLVVSGLTWRSAGRSVALFAAILLVGCAETADWHQKITLEIETPDGVKRGSSVLAVNWRDATGSSEMQMGKFTAEGEAAVVDLGEGRYLFALVRGAAGWVYQSILPDEMSSTSFEERVAYIDQPGRRAPFRGKPPLLVTFDNIADPTSLKRVDPGNLAATFGQGYALRAVTLEITNERVTEGRVEQVLPWLEKVGRERASLIPYPKGVSSDELEDPTIQLLGSSAFSTELYK